MANTEKMFKNNLSVKTFIQKEEINNEYCTYGHMWVCAHWYPHTQRDPLRAPHLALSQFCWCCPLWSDGLWFPYTEHQLVSPVLNKEAVRPVLQHHSVKKTRHSYMILCGACQSKWQIRSLFSNVLHLFFLAGGEMRTRVGQQCCRRHNCAFDLTL